MSHTLSLCVLRNIIFQDIIDLLTGDSLGKVGKSLVAKCLSALLPGRVFNKMESAYKSYYLFLMKYRP